MSSKELAIKLINEAPESKIECIIAFIQGLIADENEDENYCQNLVNEYLSSEDKGEMVSFEEAAKICGVNLDEL